MLCVVVGECVGNVRLGLVVLADWLAAERAFPFAGGRSSSAVSRGDVRIHTERETMVCTQLRETGMKMGIIWNSYFFYNRGKCHTVALETGAKCEASYLFYLK